MTEEEWDDDLEFFNKMASAEAYEPTIYEEARDWLFLHHFYGNEKQRIILEYIQEAFRRDHDMRNS
jgi:hypothetical protein